MKSAFIMDSISRQAGGLLEANRRLVQGLQSRGEEIRVFGVQDNNTEADKAVWGAVHAYADKCFGPRRFGYAPLLSERVKSYAPDILHTQGLWTYTSLVSMKWKRRTNRAEVIHPHGMLDIWALRNSRWKKRLIAFVFERRHLIRANCLRALCQAELSSFRSYGLSNPVCVIPNGIDLPNSELGYTHHSSLPPNKKILLYLGRLHPKKGLTNLLRAWALAELKDWILVIAGWDEVGHEAVLKQLAGELSINSILFLGPQFGQDKDHLYRACDAFILPSFSEGLPMVVLEAWAYAKPVLLTPMCHLPEGVAAGAALEMDAKPESIRSALQGLATLSNDALLCMGEKGKELVKQKFTWDQVAMQLQSVQEWLVKGGGMPKCVVL